MCSSFWPRIASSSTEVICVSIRRLPPMIPQLGVADWGLIISVAALIVSTLQTYYTWRQLAATRLDSGASERNPGRILGDITPHAAPMVAAQAQARDSVVKLATMADLDRLLQERGQGLTNAGDDRFYSIMPGLDWIIWVYALWRLWRDPAIRNSLLSLLVCMVVQVVSGLLVVVLSTVKLVRFVWPV
jgi:hypothetical protein